jgi:ubiquinone biosynthesis protein UbiJ
LIIGHLINKILQMDPNLVTIMQPLQHKVISIVCSDYPTKKVFCLFDSDNISLILNRDNLKADTHIEGSLASFLQLAQQSEKVPLSSLNIKVYGDLSAAQDLERFVKHLDLDWEEQLAQLTNDHLGELASRSIKKSLKIIKAQASSMTMMLGEYLNYDSNLIANKMMLEQFYQDVDNLRNAVDRLHARIENYANN